MSDNSERLSGLEPVRGGGEQSERRGGFDITVYIDPDGSVVITDLSADLLPMVGALGEEVPFFDLPSLEAEGEAQHE